MKVLHTFKHLITIELTPEEIREAVKAVNLHYVGDENCNVMKEGRLVAKYPDIERDVPAFVKAHYAIRRSHMKYIDVELLEDGTTRIKN